MLNLVFNQDKICKHVILITILIQLIYLDSDLMLLAMSGAAQMTSTGAMICVILKKLMVRQTLLIEEK